MNPRYHTVNVRPRGKSVVASASILALLSTAGLGEDCPPGNALSVSSGSGAPGEAVELGVRGTHALPLTAYQVALSFDSRLDFLGADTEGCEGLCSPSFLEESEGTDCVSIGLLLDAGASGAALAPEDGRRLLRLRFRVPEGVALGTRLAVEAIPRCGRVESLLSVEPEPGRVQKVHPCLVAGEIVVGSGAIPGRPAIRPAVPGVSGGWIHLVIDGDATATRHEIWRIPAGPGCPELLATIDGSEFSFLPSGPGPVILAARSGNEAGWSPWSDPVDVSGRPAFIRGDSNGDRTVDISDPVTTLSYLFLGAAAPGCLAAADTNSDGTVDISDPVYTLAHLFLGGPPPGPPSPPACGYDTDGGVALSCLESPCP